MSPRSTFRYEASGGPSELRSYAEGEGLTIELQEGGSIVVAWSAAIPARDFMREVGALVTANAKAQLAPATNGRQVIPFAEAQDVVERMGPDLTFIAVDSKDGSFTWEAPDPEAEPDDYPDVPGEVGVVSSALHPDWVRWLIENTASPNVRADILDILSSAELLTGDAPATSE